MIVLVIILLASLISSLTHDNSISDSRHVTATDVSGFLFGGRNHQWPAGPGRLGPHALAMSESAMPCFGSEREECQEPQESPVYRRARVSVLSCRVGAAAGAWRLRARAPLVVAAPAPPTPVADSEAARFVSWTVIQARPAVPVPSGTVSARQVGLLPG